MLSGRTSIYLKVPEKYKDKVHTIRRFHNTGDNLMSKFNCKYIYVAYLTADYWGNRFNPLTCRFDFISEVGGTSKKDLFRQIDKIEIVDSSY